MDLYEANTLVFVVKIWLEESSNEIDQTSWRGHITYILDEKRKYFQDLEEVTDFILPYLERMGVKNSQPNRLRDRLRRKVGIKRKAS
jgi:hypothetical protein